MGYSTTDIRNIALIGPAGAGKTQLTEALLYQGGAITTPGHVEQGTTVSDHSAREKSAQHSLEASVCHLDHDGIHINLLDTPGFRDFVGRTLAVLPAVETAVIVVDAAKGIDTATREFMTMAQELHLCRMIVVNKIDAENISLDDLMAQIQEAFGSECLPINLPSANAQGVVDCFFEPNGAETAFQTVEDAHEKIVDQVVEVDEELMEMYLEQDGELPADQLHSAFEKAMRDGHLVPVCFSSARAGIGVAELLQIFERVAANPTEGNPIEFRSGNGDAETAVEIAPDSEGEAVAHVFKVDIDPFRGHLGVFRVHQGTIRSGGQVYIGDNRKPLKVTHILKLNGSEQSEVESAIAGDICALPRADELLFNSVLHENGNGGNMRLDMTHLPTPVFGLAIGTNTDAEAQKVSDALQTVCMEDPSIHVEHVASQNETVVRGMGEMHLREVIEGIKDQYGIEVSSSFPSVAYRETITSKAEGHHRHKKQTGGAGQFGEVYLRVEPMSRGEGFEFIDNVVGGVIPGPFIPAVEKGIRQVLESGAISGHELHDVRVSVYDGKHHSVDSKEVAFVQAGKKAFIDAVSKAKPIVMEPIVNVRIMIPSECMGDVAGDLSSMGGMVSGTNVLSESVTEVEGQAPLREIQTYHSRLKSLSGGEGSLTMEFSHYARVSAELQRDLVNAYRPIEEE